MTGTIPLGNADRGIHAGAPDNVIGGPGPGEGNIIAHTHITGAFQTGVGVYVPASPRTTIRGNSIFDNGGRRNRQHGRRKPDGVTPNDPGDADGGRQRSAELPVALVRSRPEPDQAPGARCTQHAFDASTTSTSIRTRPARTSPGVLGGRDLSRLRPDVTTDGTATPPSTSRCPWPPRPATRIAVTATDPTGNTSELSQRHPFSIAPTVPARRREARRITIKGTDFAAGATVTVGGQPATGVCRQRSDEITATTPALASRLARTTSSSTNDRRHDGTLSKAA